MFMRTVLWTMDRAKEMIKKNAVTGIEIVPDLIIEEGNTEPEQRFKILLKCKYNAIAFLSTSYSNTAKNRERTFVDISLAAKTVGKLHAA